MDITEWPTNWAPVITLFAVFLRSQKLIADRILSEGFQRIADSQQAHEEAALNRTTMILKEINASSAESRTSPAKKRPRKKR